MVKERIPIPEETKRKLLVECGHKCSIPGCNVREDFVFHHINFDPSDNREENIIVICPNHAAAVDKKKISIKECEMYKQNLRNGIVGKEPESIKEKVEREGIDLEPESGWRRVVVYFGRKYLMWRYGRLDIPMNREIIILVVMGIVLLIPIIYQSVSISQNIKVMNSFEFMISFISAIAAIPPLTIAELIHLTKCSNCKKNFGIRRIESKEVEEKEVYRTKEEIKTKIVLHNTYECEFCGDRYSKNEVIYETMPIGSNF